MDQKAMTDHERIVTVDAEVERLEKAFYGQESDIEELLCPLLGIPKSPDYGWITGDHTGFTLVMELAKKFKALEEALEFYADPDSYFAIGIFPDRPCGPFADDTGDDHGGDYERPMHGDYARRVLAGDLDE